VLECAMLSPLLLRGRRVGRAKGNLQMRFSTGLARLRPAFARIVTVSVVAVLLCSSAMAQQPPPSLPAPQPKAAPKPAPRPAPKPAPKAEPKQPPPASAQPAQPQQGAAGNQQVTLVYSPWTKLCGRDQNQPAAKEACLTVREARLETGPFLAGASLLEQEGEQRKLLRITLPLGMQLPQGARILLDQDQPLTGRYVICVPTGCVADFDADAELVGKLKKGQTIVLQGINMTNQVASYPIPLEGFAKANEGAPTDRKKFEDDQKKMLEDLQRRQQQTPKQ
jgi:invasion protein IalB